MNMYKKNMWIDGMYKTITIDKDLWIYRGMDVENKKFKKGIFYELNKIFLLPAIKYIVHNKNYICFVTFDDEYSIKYIDNWMLSEDGKKIKRDAAENNYKSQKYLSFKTLEKIIDIQITDNGLFALTVSNEVENALHIIKWDFIGDTITNAFNIYSANVIYNNIENIKFLASDYKKMNYILLYNTKEEYCYTGILKDGDKNICFEQIEKIKNQFKNPTLILYVDSTKNNNAENYIEYWGYDNTNNIFFTYQHSICKTLNSKLLLKKLKSDYYFNNIKVTAINAFNRENKSNSKNANMLLLLATENPNIIFTAHNTIDNYYELIPLFYDKNFKLIELNNIAYPQLNGKIDILCLFDSRLIYGNKNINMWGVYDFPCIEIPNKQLEIIYQSNIKSDLFDS